MRPSPVTSVSLMMLFRRSKKSEPPPEPPEPEAADAEEAPDEDLDAEREYADELVEEDADRSWRARAAAVIPGGASTGSKQAAALYGAEDVVGPAHYISAAGCTITSAAGRSYVDCTMSLGAVALGYADSVVAHSVAEAALEGNVAGFSNVREVLVAERLCDVVPCAEQVRFLKTGAEAVAAAVRIARASTGRDLVIGCGYFGWLDWWSQGKGIPAGAHADFVGVPFDDEGALRRAAEQAGQRLAAIVLEPVIERLPSPAWIAEARARCDAAGAVLIFDEIKTGFRLRTGGYQELSGVTPDLAIFGKAMANGFPLAAVVGRADVMEAARGTWISSTLAGEATGLAAAGAVLEWHERGDVCESLWSIGAEMRSAVGRAVAASGIPGVAIEGLDPMWLMRFADPVKERRFLELAVEEGVLFKRGAYNFSCVAHDEDAITTVERAASTALVRLREEGGE